MNERCASSAISSSAIGWFSVPSGPSLRAELHSRVVRARHRDFVDEVDAMRVGERLVGFLAHCRGELRTSVAGAGAAVLHVEMQDQRLAPVRRRRESRGDRRKRIVDDRIGIAARRARAVGGLKVQPALNRAVLRAAGSTRRSARARPRRDLLACLPERKARSRPTQRRVAATRRRTAKVFLCTTVPGSCQRISTHAHVRAIGRCHLT